MSYSHFAWTWRAMPRGVLLVLHVILSVVVVNFVVTVNPSVMHGVFCYLSTRSLCV